MPVKTVGIALPPAQLKALDAMAKRDGLARSRFLGQLVEGEAARRRGREAPVVTVDGVRFVPARDSR